MRVREGVPRARVGACLAASQQDVQSYQIRDTASSFERSVARGLRPLAVCLTIGLRETLFHSGFLRHGCAVMIDGVSPGETALAPRRSLRRPERLYSEPP